MLRANRKYFNVDARKVIDKIFHSNFWLDIHKVLFLIDVESRCEFVFIIHNLLVVLANTNMIVLLVSQRTELRPHGVMHVQVRNGIWISLIIVKIEYKLTCLRVKYETFSVNNSSAD